MPIVTTSDLPKKHRAPLWVLTALVMLFLLMGVFLWSCFRAIDLGTPSRGFAFGRFTDKELGIGINSFEDAGYTAAHGDDYWWVIVKLPGGRRAGWYMVQLVWQ